MADSTLATIKGVRAKLLASASLVALVGQKIYNKAPQTTAYPFILISTTTTFDPIINSNQTFNHQIRCQAWSQVSLEEALNIRFLIFDVLHRQAITLDSPFLYINSQVGSLIDVFVEPDGKTYQSVIDFNFTIGQ